MALSPSALGALIDSNLASEGANGSNRTVFSDAVARGILMSIIGATFVTTDVGLTVGVGVGTGTGITGLAESDMVSIALSQMSSQGSNARPLMEAIMSAVMGELLNATLTTADAPVFLGTGTINTGTIAVIESVMAQNIDDQLKASGANGSNRTNLARAIAAGVTRQIITSGTGTVTITGSPTIPTPVPGVGAGTGVIT